MPVIFDDLSEFTGLPNASIFLSSLTCEGNESSLLECGSSLGLPPGLYDEFYCDNSFVGIECIGNRIFIHCSSDCVAW